MKRFKTFLLLIFLPIFIITFTSCSKNSEKNIKYDIKNKYQNGKYYVFSDYYDTHSRIAFMDITVKKNIITKVEFNYFNKNGSTLYNKKNQNDDLYFFIKNLNTAVLQNQSEDIEVEKVNDDIYDDYTSLLNIILKQAKSGDPKVKYASLNNTYTAYSSQLDSSGYNSSLEVSYKDDKISTIEFNKKNKKGESINSNSSYLSKFKSNNNISYEKYLDDIKKLSVGNKKLKMSSNKLNIDNQYNSLAKKINKKRKKFNYKKYNKFKNI